MTDAPSPSRDRELAADLRERLTAALQPVLELMDEASRVGLAVGWSLTRDQFGRQRVGEIQISRPL